jgi:hypothetical protein
VRKRFRLKSRDSVGRSKIKQLNLQNFGSRSQLQPHTNTIPRLSLGRNFLRVGHRTLHRRDFTNWWNSGRARMKDFSYALHALRPKAEAFTHQELPLPCTATLAAHSEMETVHVTNAIRGCTAASLAIYLRENRHLHHRAWDLLLPCTPAFHATRISSTGIKVPTVKPGNCFAFRLLPLDQNFQTCSSGPSGRRPAGFMTV